MLIDADWCWLMLIDTNGCWLMPIDMLIDMLIDANWYSDTVQTGFLLSERSSGVSPVIFKESSIKFSGNYYLPASELQPLLLGLENLGQNMQRFRLRLHFGYNLFNKDMRRHVKFISQFLCFFIAFRALQHSYIFKGHCWKSNLLFHVQGQELVRWK